MATERAPRAAAYAGGRRRRGARAGSRGPSSTVLEGRDRWLISYADFVTLLFAFFVVLYAASRVQDQVLAGHAPLRGTPARTAGAGAEAGLDTKIETEARGLSSAPPSQYGDTGHLGGPPPPLAAPEYRTAPLAQARAPASVAPELRPLPLLPRPAAGTPPATPRDGTPARATNTDTDARSGTAAGRFGPGSEPPVPAPWQAPLVQLARLAGGDGLSVGPPAPGPAGPGAGGPGDSSPAMTGLLERLRQNHALDALIDAELVTVRSRGQAIEVEMREGVLFASGSATVGEQALDPVARIADLISGEPLSVEVQGHTDDIPINTAIYPSNWELSAARAASVVHLLMNAGIDPSRMRAVGYGQHRPVAANNGPEGRGRNRRVVLVITPENAGPGLEPGDGRGPEALPPLLPPRLPGPLRLDTVAKNQ